MKKTIIFLCLAIIFGFFTVFSAFVFFYIFSMPGVNNLSPVASACLGAFFAFLFVRLGDFLSTIYKKKSNHHRALCKLHALCFDYYAKSFNNRQIIQNFSKLVKKTLLTNDIPIYINQFHSFEIDKSLLLDFQDLSLLNEVFNFQQDLKDINSDVANFSLFYAEIRQALLQRTISPEGYKKNIAEMLNKFKDVLKFFDYLDNKTDKLEAVVRIMLRDRFMKIFYKIKYPNQKQIEKELCVVKKEKSESVKDGKKKKRKFLTTKATNSRANPRAFKNHGRT